MTKRSNTIRAPGRADRTTFKRSSISEAFWLSAIAAMKRSQYSRRLSRFEPDAFGPHRQLGALLLKQKRWDEAIEHLSRALDARPDAGPVHFQLAVALASTGRFDVALSHARRAEELGQKLPPQFTARLKAGASGGSD